MRSIEVLVRCLGVAFVASLAIAAPAGAADAVMAWGEGHEGQLGNGTATFSNVPVAVCAVGAAGPCPSGPFLSGVSEISAGESFEGGGRYGNTSHNLALLSNGTVVAWGTNEAGELGDGSSANSDVPVPVCAVGWVGPCPNGPYLSGVTAVSAANLESLALLSNGTVVVWGEGTYGELGSPSPETCYVGPCSTHPVAVSGLSGVTAIAAGGWYNLALTREGQVMAWGSSESGELGNGTWETTSEVPAAVIGLSEVTAIAASPNGASLALVGQAGRVEAWGENIYGALGDGLDSVLTGLPEECHGEPCSTVPVAVCAVGAAGPCPSGPYLSGVTAISAGGSCCGSHSFALLGNHTLVGWGFDFDGLLGVGTSTGPESCYVNGEPCSTTPVPVCAVGAAHPCPSGPPLSGVTVGSAGSFFSLALQSNGTVTSWGEDEFGQLADGFGNGVHVGPEHCHGRGGCSTTPITVSALSGATAVSAGDFTGLAITPAPQPHWYKKTAELVKGAAPLAVTSAAKLRLHVFGGETKCNVKDLESIWNPLGAGAGEDEVTAFTLASCKATPAVCPVHQTIEVLPKGLSWSSHLFFGPPVRDELERVKLEFRCSGSGYLDEYAGTLTPEVGNGVLTFASGSGELEDTSHNTLAVTGTDTLKAAPGKIAAH
jgi:alpha-tubulin suppressor-like RCC1 family protein